VILHVAQTKHGVVGTSAYEVLVDGRLAYRGSAPAVSGYLTCWLADADGKLVCTTEEDIAAAVLSVLGKIIRPYAAPHAVLDSEGVPQGRIVPEVEMRGDDEQAIVHYTFDVHGAVFRIYTIRRGVRHRMLVLHEGRQIGQANKPLARTDNLDQYTLYLLDEFREYAAWFALFLIDVDSRIYGRRGRYEKGSIFWWVYFRSRYEPIYDPLWLTDHFGVPPEDEAAEKAAVLSRIRSTLIAIGIVAACIALPVLLVAIL